MLGFRMHYQVYHRRRKTMHCFIFDIDGTLANLQHRLHYIEKRPKDWEGFFNACVDDEPIEHMICVCQALYPRVGYQGKSGIVFVSGRPERSRDQTVRWLEKWGAWQPHYGPINLYMRPDGDRRDDFIVKQELLDRVKSDGF